MTTDDERLPRWASAARGVFRAALGFYVLLWLIGGILWAVDSFVVDLPATTDLETVRTVAVITVLAAGAASGLVWLAGEAVSGYREPKD